MGIRCVASVTSVAVAGRSHVMGVLESREEDSNMGQYASYSRQDCLWVILSANQYLDMDLWRKLILCNCVRKYDLCGN